MHGVPTTSELAEAVREFLEREVMPTVGDRLQFRTRVAVNVLRQIERELANGPRPGTTAEERRLAREIRSGAHDGDLQSLLATLRPACVARVRLTNPRHLLADDRL